MHDAPESPNKFPSQAEQPSYTPSSSVDSLKDVTAPSLSPPKPPVDISSYKSPQKTTSTIRTYILLFTLVV